MENPKGYIIYIKNHEYSVQWANEALASGRALGWNLELYEGIDGTKQSLNDFGVKIYQGSKKCVRLLSRPGTQGCFLSQYHLYFLYINNIVFLQLSYDSNTKKL